MLEKMQHKRFKFQLDNFLTEAECKDHISFSENEGFREAKINTRERGEIYDKNTRNNDRVVIELPDLAEALFEKVKDHCPQEMGEWKILGLNERFRFYRYKDGQEFKVHPDGAFKRNENEISMVTMLVYLNEDFVGGETEFVMPWDIVEPKIGKLLLFAHKQLHKGNPVFEGTKYVLRTDVMYKK
jgi:prolyl 4-hydroxylase